MPVWVSILLGFLGSAGFFTFLQFMISRSDNKRSQYKEVMARLDKTNERLKKGEKDSCRIQLLLMMSDYPKEYREIMMLASHYFKDLKGNWYTTLLFESYLKREGLEFPTWFNASSHEEEIKGVSND